MFKLHLQLHLLRTRQIQIMLLIMGESANRQ
jgi:hypothetical protein